MTNTVIPNIEIVIKVIYEVKTRDFELYELLEREFVSFCFSIKIVTEDVEKLNEIINKQYSLNLEQINKLELQKLIFDYLAHIDSTLDYFDKFIKNLKRVNIKYERNLYDFDSLISMLRNDVIHEGIPKIKITYSDANYVNSFICYQWVGTIEKEKDQNIYIEIEIDNKDLSLQDLINKTYIPMIHGIKSIFDLIVG